MPTRKLERVSTADLQRELRRRAQHVSTLEVKRVELVQQIDGLDAEIEALGGSPESSQANRTSATRRASRSGIRSRAARTRAANSMTLTTALQKVLSGATMGVTEAADAVQRAGYKTHSENFRTMVNITLLKRKDLFRKQGRGLYTAK